MKFRYFIALFLLVALPTVASAAWTQKTVVFKTESAGNVAFEHAAHLKKRSTHCTSCHNYIFNIVPSKNLFFTMADMEKGEACGGCHNGDIAFSVKSNCATCHLTHDIKFKVPSMGTVTFSHKEHTAMFGCKECHPKRFIPGPGNKTYTMAEMGRGEACGGCHNGDIAFSVKSNCATCHPNRDVVFKEPAFGTVTFSHKIHTVKLKCRECHPKRFRLPPGKKAFTMADMNRGLACGGCHNGKKIFSVKTDCSACHKTHDVFFKDPSFGVVTFRHKQHIAMFGCKECHPKRFLPGPGNKAFTMAEMNRGKACGGCHNGDVAFSVKTDCTTCHLDHDVVFKDRDMGNVTFSHKKHTAMFGCKECHPKRFVPGFDNLKLSMAEMYQGKACGSCHDGKTAFNVKDQCHNCHKK
jgi:c(7)-type cytochrome triheme protein